jgi:hypothetical protein
MRRITTLVTVLTLTSAVGACEGATISGPPLTWGGGSGGSGGGGGAIWSMSAPTDAVLVGDTVRFQVYRQTTQGPMPEPAEAFGWSTADTTIAVVDQRGLVTGVRRGATMVHAYALATGIGLGASIQVRNP